MKIPDFNKIYHLQWIPVNSGHPRDPGRLQSDPIPKASEEDDEVLGQDSLVGVREVSLSSLMSFYS